MVPRGHPVFSLITMVPWGHHALYVLFIYHCSSWSPSMIFLTVVLECHKTLYSLYGPWLPGATQLKHGFAGSPSVLSKYHGSLGTQSNTYFLYILWFSGVSKHNILHMIYYIITFLKSSKIKIHGIVSTLRPPF